MLGETADVYECYSGGRFDASLTSGFYIPLLFGIYTLVSSLWVSSFVFSGFSATSFFSSTGHTCRSLVRTMTVTIKGITC